MRYYIGLGSNDGFRVSKLLDAVDRLRRSTHGLRVECFSIVYQSQEVRYPIPPFANAAVAITCESGPAELLDLTREIESRAGRIRNPEREVPVALDMDILFWESEDGFINYLRASDPCVPHIAVPLWDVASDPLRRWLHVELKKRDRTIESLRSRLWELLDYNSIRLSRLREEAA